MAAMIIMKGTSCDTLEGEAVGVNTWILDKFQACRRFVINKAASLASSLALATATSICMSACTSLFAKLTEIRRKRQKLDCEAKTQYSSFRKLS